MKKQYRVRITTHYPSFVVEAENEEQAKDLAISDYLPLTDHPDACSFFDVEEDSEDEDDSW